ncbi:MAG: CCA tRNA nucleotidyltransferase [Alphaproteobacteria bacterium]
MIRDNYLDVSKIIKDKKILRLFKAVENYGGVLRFVGGCVRDAIMGIDSADINLATDLSPDELVEACEDRSLKTVAIGIKTDCIGVVINDSIIEVTSLHKIVTEGKQNIIQFTTDWSVDASSRDLTINAVYADEKGNVFDYYNGIDDLENGVIRFIGNPNQRIKEDYTRILRFFRFYSSFGKGEPDKKSLQACIDNKEGLKTVSIDRLKDELKKILLTKNVVNVMKIMADNDILSHVIPTPKNLSDLDFLVNWFDDSKIGKAGIRRLFMLLHANSKEQTEFYLNVLKFSNKGKAYYLSLDEENIELSDYEDSKKLLEIIYKYGNEFCIDKLIILCVKKRLKMANIEEIIQSIQEIKLPKFEVGGKDVIGFGVKNQQIKLVLNYLEALWIESGFTLSKEELIAKAETVSKEIA